MATLIVEQTGIMHNIIFFDMCYCEHACSLTLCDGHGVVDARQC